MVRKLMVWALACASFGAWAAEVKQSAVPRTVVTYKMMSAALGQERSYNVLLPPDYEQSTRRYPVLYLLHGYGDDHTAWSYMTNLSGYVAEQPVIVIMPDGSRSFYVNSAGDPKAKFEDFIARELVAEVDMRFRTIPLPRARAVAGLSMGGYGAMFVGLKHHRRFSAVGAFSGALGLARDNQPAPTDEAARKRQQDIQVLFGANGSPERAERDPFRLLEKVPVAEMPMIYIACGGQDFLVESNRDFVKLLASKKIPYEYREVSPRGHTWDFWDDHVKVFLGMLAERPGWNR